MKANIYISRLYALALFLQRWELLEQMYHTPREYRSSNENCTVEYYYWCFRQLPRIFPRLWHTNDQLHPYLEVRPRLNPVSAAAVFFNLSGAEVFALFVPGHEYLPYNLKKLERDARPGDLAYRIFVFMNYKQKELDKIPLINLKRKS